MKGWTSHEGIAVALDRESIDTDQLIPARFMSTPRHEGYGAFLLHDMRFEADGTPVDTFPLNRVPHASVLITRRNFGSGSSREAAVYALMDFGICAIIAPSFGDIFASNAVNNGLLPAQVDADAVEAIITSLPDNGVSAQLCLATGTARIGDTHIPFQIDPAWREKLIKGWDDIDLTRHHAEKIAVYRADHAQHHPWAFPRTEAARQQRDGDPRFRI